MMAFTVSQGKREIGIRMALGATRHEILKLVVVKGMTLAVSGVAIGLAAALVFTGLYTRSLLFALTRRTPRPSAPFHSCSTLVALAAIYVPARRAANIEPILCLRSE